MRANSAAEGGPAGEDRDGEEDGDEEEKVGNSSRAGAAEEEGELVSPPMIEQYTETLITVTAE